MRADVVTAVAPSPVVPSAPPQVVGWESTWDDFYANVVDPLAAVAVPFLVTVLALLVLARALVPVVPLARRSSVGEALGVRVAGSTGIVVGAAGLTWVAAAHARSGSPAWHVPVADWVVFGVISAVGVLFLAHGTAQRLGLVVVARTSDGDDVATAQHVTALVQALGVRPPQGIGVPVGLDTTALSDALEGLPTNPALKVVTGIVKILAGTTPWKAEVVTQAEGVVDVQISRNGRLVDAMSVDRPALGNDVEHVDLHRMTAAFVVMTLADHYTGFEGLGGATRWQSVGRSFVASTDLAPPEHAAARKSLLVAAVNRDPGNKFAQFALRTLCDRGSADPAVLTDYAGWLEAFAESCRERDPALRLRALYSHAAVLVDRDFLDGIPATFPIAAPSPAPAAVLALVQAVEEDPDLMPEVSAAAEQMRLHVVLPEVPGSAPREAPTGPTTPAAHYNAGCYWAIRAARAPTRIERADAARQAVLHLRLGRLDASLARQMVSDPQLAEFRRLRAWDELRPPEDTSAVLDGDAFASYATLLRGAGLDTAPRIVAAGAGRVAAVTGATRRQARRLVRAARTAAAQQD